MVEGVNAPPTLRKRREGWGTLPSESPNGMKVTNIYDSFNWPIRSSPRYLAIGLRS